MTRQRDSKTNPHAEGIAVRTCDVLVIGSGIAGICLLYTSDAADEL